MESIRKYIKDDEKVLFQRSLINPAHKKNIKAMIIIGGISLLLIIPIIICLILRSTYIYYFIMSILLIITSVVFGFISLGLYLPYYMYMKVLQLDFNQIKQYKDIYILTNKRWIQKSLDVLNINETIFPLEITKHNDIIFIDFNQIKSIFTQRKDSANSYFFGFDLKFPWGQELFIPYVIFPEFIKILKEVIPIKREVHAKHGVIYYYRD
ncbi:MAG: hypothetical protein ACFFDF_01875 [Candidatus Odinarchaeota archaeon]